jgi:transcriptional regulator with XRE-family HTH domain
MRPYGGGWTLSERTGGASVGRTGATMAIVSAFLIGTGGLMTADYVAKRSDRGYKFNHLETPKLDTGLVQRTPAENLARVREVLKPPVSELASMIGVSRQAVYDWQNGSHPLPEHAKRLADLAEAADIFVAEGIVTVPRLLSRRVDGRKSMFEHMREGEAVVDAARALAHLLRRESEQRAKLQVRLGTRTHPPLDHEAIGVPMLDERG